MSGDKGSPEKRSDGNLSLGALVGGVIGGVVVILLVIVVVLVMRRKNKKKKKGGPTPPLPAVLYSVVVCKDI